MKVIKPREIFNLLNNPSMVTLQMPRGPWGDEVNLGITLLETFLLIAVARLVSAAQIFEIGTWRGATAKALAQNLRKAVVYTLDREQSADFKGFLNVCPIQGDSRKFSWKGFCFFRFDLIFVDGAHDLETFISDTKMAESVVSKSGVIVWHDYGNPDFPHIKDILDRGPNVITIHGTQLALKGLKL